MALIDAGIAMTGFVSSATVAVGVPNLPSASEMAVDGPVDSDLILDPNEDQSDQAHAILVAAWDQKGRQLLSSYKLRYNPKEEQKSPGEQEDSYWRATGLANKAAAKTLNFQRQTIKQKLLYESSAGLPSSTASAATTSTKAQNTM